MSHNNEQELTQWKSGVNDNNTNQPVLITSLEEEKLAVIDLNDNEIEENERNNRLRNWCGDRYRDNIFYKILSFYLYPITKDIRYSLRCILFNALTFPITLGLFIFDVTAIATSVPLCAVACVGLVLLWFTFEFILMFAYLDLKIAYYLVEKEEEINNERKHLLELSVYTKKLPFCFCWNDELEHNNWCYLMLSRIKSLYISLDLYLIIIYHIIAKPLIALFTIWPVIPILYALYMIAAPFLYAIDNTVLDNNQICYFGGSACNDNGNDCTCYGWAVHDMGMAFLVGFSGLIGLPLTLRLNNFFANISKKFCYFFYTYYYTKNETLVTDRKALLSAYKDNKIKKKQQREQNKEHQQQQVEEEENKEEKISVIY